jgi:hypothetical protein
MSGGDLGARKVAVLGDAVVSVRPLDGGERRALRALAWRGLRRNSWFLLVSLAFAVLSVVSRSPYPILLAAPFVVLLPFDLAENVRALRLVGDARAGFVYVFASGGERSERLARSGRLWSRGEEPAAWRSM